MAKVERFEDLDCWKAARELVNYVYDLCQNELLAKDFFTSKQIKAGAVSTKINIAEGFGRFSKKEFIRFLEISQASGLEVRSLSYILIDRKYITESEFEELQNKTNKVINLVNGLIRYLNGRNRP
jgi:four helix bundle protein